MTNCDVCIDIHHALKLQFTVAKQNGRPIRKSGPEHNDVASEHAQMNNKHTKFTRKVQSPMFELLHRPQGFLLLWTTL